MAPLAGAIAAKAVAGKVAAGAAAKAGGGAAGGGAAAGGSLLSKAEDAGFNKIGNSQHPPSNNQSSPDASSLYGTMQLPTNMMTEDNPQPVYVKPSLLFGRPNEDTY